MGEGGSKQAGKLLCVRGRGYVKTRYDASGRSATTAQQNRKEKTSSLI